MIDHNQSQNPEWIPERAPKSIVGTKVYTCEINPGTYNQLQIWESGNLNTSMATQRSSQWTKCRYDYS